uniref:Coiled-coil domain-containing protein 181 n=1 Tax=Stegastes partitus TaxID=144197 RepID=A0A3B5B6S1_9TELE
EEYEDDFEKDLDWLISEEGQSEDQGPDYEDIEAQIDKELEEDEKRKGVRRKQKGPKVERRGNKAQEEDEERWPSPMEPLEYDSDRDSLSKSPPIIPPPPGMDEQTDEEKKYILEKIQQANRELQDQEAPDMTRRRRLHFKETLVDLVVPPEKDGGAEADSEVSGKLSELKLSPRDEGRSRESGDGGQGMREGRVLVEKDGKFDLVSLKEVESQGLLPPIANFSDCSHSSQQKIHSSSASSFSASLHQGIEHLRAPRPPAQPRSRPSSASHSQRGGGQRRSSRRRVQSATGAPCQPTYTLSAQQKVLLQKMQERRDKVAREEQRKREEEELKRQENELAFKAWLMRKREQLQEERRIHRAQEIERINSTKDSSDPEEAFRLWLQRKQEQQQKEKQLVELKRLEEDSSFLLRSREECERAFKWLRRKRAEKRAEQQAARERSRRLVLEERRARRMRDLLCINETKPFRFSEQLVYRF